MKTKTNRVFVRALFVGENGSMGLLRNDVYYIRVYNDIGYIWVDWGDNACPYSSFDTLAENWILLRG